MDRNPSQEVAAALQSTLGSALGELLEPGEDVALVNFPKWGNLGDAAMWLGEVAALGRLGARIRYRADSRLYRRRLVSAAVGERGTILLHGGGNIGDVYPLQQRVRQRILRDFPEAQVIQLPQTIWYRKPERGRRFGEACRAHGGFRLMVREGSSAERARDQLGLEPLLAPDAAFGLGPQQVPGKPKHDLLWLMRDDRERTVSSDRHGNGSPIRDWPDKFGRGEPRGRRLRAALFVNRIVSLPLERELKGGGLAVPLLGRSYDSIARRRLALALETIGSARVVVTDRLHGHILCTLAGVPHVVLDNASGKSRAMYETWTSESKLIRFADDVEEAETHAGALLAELDQPAAPDPA